MERSLKRSHEEYIVSQASRFGIAPSKKAFITGDVEEAVSAVAKAVMVGPFMLAGWLIKSLIPILVTLAVAGLLLFGLRQL